MSQSSILCTLGIIPMIFFGLSSAANGIEKVERITVTGTGLQKSDAPSIRMETIGREFIESVGAINISDVIRMYSTAANFGGYSSEVNLGTTPYIGSESANIGGIGEKSTSVMLNGKPIAINGISNAVDLNSFPLSAVERIEIIRGPGSAVYGNSSSGGIVNIITRKTLSNWETSGRIKVPRGGSGRSTLFGLSHMAEGMKFKSATFFNRSDESKVMLSDKPWTKDGKSTFAIPGNYKDIPSGSWFDYSNSTSCEETNEEGLCLYSYSDQSYYKPKKSYNSLLNILDFDIGARNSLNSTVLVTTGREYHKMAPNAAQFIVPSEIADSLDLENHEKGNAILVRYRPVGLGQRIRDSKSQSLTLNLGWERKIGDRYSLNSNLHYGEYHTKTELSKGYGLLNSINQLIADGAFSPFDSQGADKIAAAGYSPWQEHRYKRYLLNSTFEGDLTTISDVELLFKVGLFYSHDSYNSDADEFSQQVDPVSKEGLVLGASSSVGNGTRTGKGMFGELLYSPLESIELKSAVRTEYHEEVGHVSTPQYDITISPTETLSLGLHYGEGFRLPSLRESFLSGAVDYPFIADNARCEAENLDCKPVERKTITSGNKKLKPERSYYRSVSLEIKSSPKFKLRSSLWKHTILDQINIEPDIENILIAEKNGVLPEGIKVKRASGGQFAEIEEIEVRPTNSSKAEISGVDLDLILNIIPSTSLTSKYSRTLSYREAKFEGLSETNKVGEFGFPAWKNIAMVSSRISRFSLNLSNLRIASHSKKNSTGRVGEYSSWGISTQYYFERSTVGFTAGNIQVDHFNLGVVLAYLLWFGVTDLHAENLHYDSRLRASKFMPLDIESVFFDTKSIIQSHLVSKEETSFFKSGLAKFPIREKYLFAVLSGFDAFSKFMGHHQKDVLSDDTIRLVINQPIRIIPRNTSLYKKYIGVGGEEFSKCENLQLLRGDIPFYHYYLDSGDIYYQANGGDLVVSKFPERLTSLPNMQYFFRSETQIQSIVKANALTIARYFSERLESTSITDGTNNFKVTEGRIYLKFGEYNLATTG